MAVWQEDFHSFAQGVFAIAMDTAREIALTGEPPLPVDFDPRRLNHRSRASLLDAVEGRPIARPRANFGGEPIAADIAAHEAVKDFIIGLEGSVGAVHLVGEEADDEDWERYHHASPGTPVLALDAIDGSAPFEDLTFGFGTTLLAFLRTSDGVELKSAAVCNSSGLFVSMDHHEIVVGDLADEDDPLPHQKEDLGGANHSLAVVGAKPSDRRDAALLLGVSAHDPLVVYNLGGAPAALGLVLGRLRSLVALRAQTPWDAAFVPILSALDMPIVSAETGDRYSTSEIAVWFSTLSDVEVPSKSIPPFVVARSVEDAQVVVDRLRGA